MGSCAWLSALFALQLACQAPALLSTRPLQDARSLETSSARLIHTVVPSECSEYQDWQVLGQFWSWKKIGSPGMFTRIACCEMGKLKGQNIVNPYQVYYTNTNVDPEGIEDNYIPYNKPYGVMSWLQDVKPAGDYFLIVDPDMTFHRSFTVDELKAGPGWGAAQHMWSRSLLQEEEEAVNMLGEEEARLPLADEVGEVYLNAAEDLTRIAPLWWNYTKQMRVFHETYAKELPKDTPLERPWIAEMYGIALGAAQLGVHHHGYHNLVMHPPGVQGALNQEGPNMVVSHYAWNAEVPSFSWKWNKHAFKNWSALSCPPWNLDQQFSREAWGEQYNGSTGGLFPHPPYPSELTNQAPADLFQDLANIEMVGMLNEGFCELHHKVYCPPSEELIRECGKATRVMQELVQYYQRLANGSSIFCLDTNPQHCAQVQQASNKKEDADEASEKEVLFVQDCMHA
ncbi:hypothetical protein WJX79_007135 [Trebouxia sp. C0005]